jgi:hypothetical protein
VGFVKLVAIGLGCLWHDYIQLLRISNCQNPDITIPAHITHQEQMHNTWKHLNATVLSTSVSAASGGVLEVMDLTLWS